MSTDFIFVDCQPTINPLTQEKTMGVYNTDGLTLKIYNAPGAKLVINTFTPND